MSWYCGYDHGPWPESTEECPRCNASRDCLTMRSDYSTAVEILSLCCGIAVIIWAYKGC